MIFIAILLLAPNTLLAKNLPTISTVGMNTTANLIIDSTTTTNTSDELTTTSAQADPTTTLSDQVEPKTTTSATVEPKTTTRSPMELTATTSDPLKHTTTTSSLVNYTTTTRFPVQHTTTTTTFAIPSGCPHHTCSEDGLFPEAACSPAFCQCEHGIEHPMVCQEGTVFNPKTGVCDWAWNNPGCDL